MAKNYRGDTLPIVASYDGYTFQKGDTVTAGDVEMTIQKNLSLGKDGLR